MWRALRRGDAQGEFHIEEQNVFSGGQSQRITFTGGQGEVGIENQSLNRWGMNFVRGKASKASYACMPHSLRSSLSRWRAATVRRSMPRNALKLEPVFGSASISN